MIFINNKYTQWYFSIIENAKNRNLSFRQEAISVLGYVENHHIIPKSLGGNNQKNNLVFLTAREHVVCHRLLVKMTNGSNKRKMIRAVINMIGSRKHHITSKQYELLKIKHAESMSGNNNPMCRPEIKIKQTLSKRKTMKDPIKKESHRLACVKAKNDSNNKKKFLKTISSEEHREKCRATSLENWNDSSRREKMSQRVSGENNPSYDHTIYEWEHKSGLRIKCTRNHLQHKFNLSGSKLSLVVRHINKSHKGWQVLS